MMIKTEQMLGFCKTVICEFFKTGMAEVMPVLLLSVYPRRTLYVLINCGFCYQSLLLYNFVEKYSNMCMSLFFFNNV